MAAHLLQLLQLLLVSDVPSASTVSKPVPVFTWGEGGYPVYREPAVLLLPSGTLLAFIEGGQNHLGAADSYLYPNSNSDVVSKLSSDGGKSWGPLSVVLKNASQPGVQLCGPAGRPSVACPAAAGRSLYV
eukprot:COSAG01_NODE_655_length_14476_cov_6.592265_8_plen_130_part_00